LLRRCIRCNGEARARSQHGGALAYLQHGGDMSAINEVLISTHDASALQRLLADIRHTVDVDESTEALTDKLSEARIVGPHAVPDHVVRFRSTVIYEELPSRARRRVMLVTPREADAGAGRISVLSPIGRALLGLSKGNTVEVQLPTGRKLSVRVADVTAPALDEVDEPSYA
jgi:regulator of nucleoside diphosphate kinase